MAKTDPDLTLDLADLIDLEYQHELDRSGDAVLARDRDRDWGPGVMAELGVRAEDVAHRLAGDRSVRVALSRAWLRRLRDRDDSMPGRRVAGGLGAVGWILILLGALTGWGAATAALHYDGSVPVNVLGFIGLFFVLQLVLLVAMMAVLLVRRRGGGVGLFARLVGTLAQSPWLDRFAGAAAAHGSLRSIGGLYGDVGRWVLFRTTQWFGVAFNVAALATCLATVTFTDLVFAWSTTLDVSAAQVHTYVAALGLPWSWIEDAVPSASTVEASQWMRMEGRFVDVEGAPSDSRATAAWWRYLVLGLVAYGLLPRLAALALGAAMARAAQRRVSLDHGGYQRLFERLLFAARSRAWQGPDADRIRGDAPDVTAAGGAARAEVERAAQQRPRWLVAWGRLGGMAERLREQWVGRGVDVVGTLAAGGADLAQDRRCVEDLGERGAQWVTVVFDADQQPTKEVLAFLASIREATGPTVCLTAALLFDSGASFEAPDKDQWDAWDRSLRAVGDPYLWLEGGDA